MRFDHEKKTIEISIREVSYSAANEKQGSYISKRLRAKIGQDAHTNYQNNSMGENEYYTKFYHQLSGWNMLIRGRADVVYKADDSVIVEEIKSVTTSVNANTNAAHILQLQLYAHYFRVVEKIEKVEAYLVIIDPVNNKQRREKVSTPNKTRFLNKYFGELIDLLENLHEEKEKKKQRVNSLEFPYQEFRPYQEDLMNSVRSAISNKDRLVIAAPPGLGKTISTFYPALEYALANGMRLFVVTSKTTQQKIYRETVDPILQMGGDFTTIILTAKGKICHTEEFACIENDCPYLSNYMNTDVDEIISDLMELKVIDREPVEEAAKIFDICPFELSLDIAMQCDVMISDFNYIFHPLVRFQRFQGAYNDAILIVDEAHNLVPRSADFYSDKITLRQLQSVINSLNRSEIRLYLRNKGVGIIRRIYRHIQSLKDQIANFEYVDHCLVEFDDDLLYKLQDQYDDFIIQYINALPYELSKKDDMILFADRYKFFTSLLKDSIETEFDQIYDVDDAAMRILCKSAAKKLRIQFKEFHSVIVQSATLHPFKYYIDMLGLPRESTILDLPNPFPKDNQLYLVYPSVSTTYKDREHYIDEIANLILDTIKLKTGNYLVFFPSFNFLNQVLGVINKQGQGYNILVQDRSMIDRQRDEFLKRVTGSQNNLIFLVMGGIFSEGIDFTGNMAIGCFVVGPALPQLNFDQELRKLYFDEVYRQGFDYAYRNPGITKVIQSAGRIFRNATDRGFVILIGRRFATEYYRDILPQYYDPNITENIVDEISKFWNK